MAAVNKIDSNQVGLRYQEETSIGVANTSNNWEPLEPNSFADFGGEISTVARNPINPSRQRKKGVTTDIDASGGFNTDLTQVNLQDIMQGFFFANFRTKDELAVAIVDGTGNDYEPVSGGDNYVANDLLFAKGFGDAANNGLKVVTGTPVTASVPVTDTGLVTAAAQSGIISRVGFLFAAGDLDVDSTGSLPTLTTSTKDLTELGLIAGEWIFLGGDVSGGAGDQFLTAANNGFKRVKSIAANVLTIDKSDLSMVTEASTAETLRMFFGRVLKNELGTSIIRRTYHLERTLGAPDDALPAQVQAEYIEGAVGAEAVFNIPSSEKITVDLSFVGIDVGNVDGPTALRAGARPALVEADAFNTSSDFSRIRLAVLSATDEAPTALFAFVQELTLGLNNNLSPNKAIGQRSAFEVTAGTFEVGGSLTAYFSSVAAINSVINNDDITLDFTTVKSNAGITFDVPLITLGDGRPNVEQDEPITIPLEMAAATGAGFDANMDHTLLFVFWDFLPNAADFDL